MSDLLRALELKLRIAIGNLFRRGELTMCSDQFGAQFKGYAGDEEGEEAEEQFDDVELWQQYGIASRPPAGAEVLAANLMGSSENAIAFATNSYDDRPSDLAEGEVVTHGKKVAAGQAQVRHKPDGTLALACATGKFVEVGGNAAKLIKGESLNSAIGTWIDALALELAPLGADITADNVTLKAQLAAALASKGKVS